MKRCLKMALPLVFSFILTLMPFGLLEYNQYQRELIQRERALTLWEQDAGNYLQLFKAFWSIESQIKRKMFFFKKARLRAGFSEKYNGSRFIADLRCFFTEKYMPEFMYAGLIDKSGHGLQLFSGSGFSRLKQRFFGRILENLARESELTNTEMSAFNGMVRGAFGDNVDFELLKSFRRGKVSRVLFEGSMKLLFWDILENSNGSKVIYLQLFSPKVVDRTTSMRFAADVLSARNSRISSVLVPLEFANKKLKPIFDSTVPDGHRLAINRLYAEISGQWLKRDQVLPAGKFITHNGVRIMRDFIDHSVPYEIWVLSRGDISYSQNSSYIAFLLRLFFFAGWVLVFARVFITGQPVGISLKSWLTLTFMVVGILPLGVFFVAGIFHVDSSAFRREQEAVKDSLQRLEEADTSGEIILAQYRDACRRWTQEKSWLQDLAKWDESAWEKAVQRLQPKLKEAGLKVGAVYVYPPDIAGVKDRFFILQGSNIKPAREQRMQKFYLDWIRKSYFNLCPEVMVGNEPDLPIFQGQTGREILRYFLSNRGDVEFLDLDDFKQFLFQDYILVNGVPRNWYFFRFDISKVFEDYLKETVISLQHIYSDSLYAIALIENTEAKVIFPERKSKDFQVVQKVAGHLIEQAAMTRSKVIQQTDDSLVVVYPCVKSGSSVLANVVFFSAFRAAAYAQELILTIVVLLMSVPVFLMSRLAADYLVSPLLGVEGGLKKIADENYSIKLSLNREDELGILTDAFDRMVAGLKERLYLGRFVSATLDEHVTKSVETEHQGLESRFGAVLCSDIRSFTTLSEKYQIRDIVAMLNEHLTGMSECIRQHNGFVEQFVGDAVLAVFHASSLKEASQNAVEAAIAMILRHQEINRKRYADGLFSYEIGIGIESGQLLSGIISAGERREYAVVGIARNTAEQLEASSKMGRFTKIVVSPQVYELVDGFKFVKLADDENWEIASLEAME